MPILRAVGEPIAWLILGLKKQIYELSLDRLIDWLIDVKSQLFEL
jgi:hypothetical protein